MLRAVLIAALLPLAPAAMPGPAYAAGASEPGAKCEQGQAKKKHRSIMGGMLGGLADSALGRAGVPTSVVGISVPVGSLLSNAILNLLDCKEQQQAAAATDEAVRGGVGAESSWTSETRPNVSGSSKVTGEQQLADGANCMLITDVVIVDGEETTVDKRLCRSPGGGNYVIAV
jgi:surface antigen